MCDDPDSDERSRLEGLITLCAKRRSRADVKAVAALAERLSAQCALDAARQRLADWEKSNPDPQRSIFEELPNV